MLNEYLHYINCAYKYHFTRRLITKVELDFANSNKKGTNIFGYELIQKYSYTEIVSGLNISYSFIPKPNSLIAKLGKTVLRASYEKKLKIIKNLPHQLTR